MLQTSRDVPACPIISARHSLTIFRGGRFTFRLQHPITPVLYEALLFALIGDQFDETERVVGCVLSVRQQEDLISVWVEEEGEAVKSGALRYVHVQYHRWSLSHDSDKRQTGLTMARDKLLTLLSLPATTTCEYRSNKTMLEAAAMKDAPATAGAGGAEANGAGSAVNGGANANGSVGGYGTAPGGEREGQSGQQLPGQQQQQPQHTRRNYHSNYHNHNHHGHGHHSHRERADHDEQGHGQGQGQGQGFGGFRYGRRDRGGSERPEDGPAPAGDEATGANGGNASTGTGSGMGTIGSGVIGSASQPPSARTSRFGQFSHTPLAPGSGAGFAGREARNGWGRSRAE